MSKRVWVVAGGFVLGLVVIGGLYELNSLVQDYASLTTGTSAPEAITAAAVPQVEEPGIEAQGDAAERPSKAERRRERKARRVAGAADDREPVIGTALAEGQPSVMAVRPELLAESHRPDLRAVRRRARLTRRGTRIAESHEMPRIDAEGGLVEPAPVELP